jgi:uncharacterized protein (TIGR00369 family)
MPAHRPKDPDFAAKVQASFARQAAMQTFGITLLDVQPGLVELEMPFNERFTQQNGFLHAGIVTTALDTACGYAAHSLMERYADVLTVEFKVNLLSPARGGLFRFIGEVVRSGRTLTFCDGRAFSQEKGRSKLVASISCTLISLDPTKR